MVTSKDNLYTVIFLGSVKENHFLKIFILKHSLQSGWKILKKCPRTSVLPVASVLIIILQHCVLGCMDTNCTYCSVSEDICKTCDSGFYEDKGSCSGEDFGHDVDSLYILQTLDTV